MAAGTPGSPARAGLLDVRRPFTRADAIAAGISPAVLRGSRFRRLFRGVYVGADADVDIPSRARAALLLHPGDAFVSHQTAAAIWAAPVPDTADVHVSVRRERDRRPRPGLRSHLSPPQVTVQMRRGIAVSSPVDTLVALAQQLGLIDLVIVGDAMVRLRLTTPDELRAASAASRDRRAVAAREAAHYVRRGVDSPMETRLRMLIVLSGLPEPAVNHAIRTADGDVLMRFDLSYPSVKLVVEYDGRQHGDDTRQWRHDLERREALDRSGWRIIVVTSHGIFRDPAQTLWRIRQGLEERGATVPSGPLREAWMPHFPGR